MPMDAFDAAYDAGVLRLRTPAADQAKSRKIAVRGGGAARKSAAETPWGGNPVVARRGGHAARSSPRSRGPGSPERRQCEDNFSPGPGKSVASKVEIKSRHG